MNSKLLALLYGTGTFLLPVIILIAAAGINGLYPFGPDMFITADMRTQYLDFFAWYRDVLMGNVDPLYSTTQAMGNNMLPTFGYYLASPFNLLLPFFREEDIPAFFFLITLLKAGCIQLSIQFFLRRRFNLDRLWSCALGLGFTLSLWTITQLRNPQWMDGLIFLPLCAWGVCCLLRQGRWRLLAVSFGGCVLTCWYMGYMVGLFLCLYVLFEGYVLNRESASLPRKLYRKRLLGFCGTMALGLAVSAIVFLPCVEGMLSSGTTQGGHAKLSVSHEVIAEHLPFLADISLTQVIAGLLIVAVVVIAAVFLLFRKRSLLTRASIVLFIALVLCLVGCLAMPAFQHGSVVDVVEALTYGKWVDSKTPQLFASFLTLLLAITFFCLRRLPLKLKLATALFLFLLLLSGWLYPLQYVWGGLRVPAGYHSRMAFLFIFMLTWCAAYGLRALLDVGASDAPEPSRFATGLSTFAAKRPVAVAALVLTCVGVLIRTTVTWYYFYDSYPQSYIDEYMENARTQVEELEQRDPGVYRVEKAYWRFNEGALNEGMSLGINQVASYTSTGDQNVMAFLSSIGFGDNLFYTYDFHLSLVGESLLGVKYLSSDGQPQNYVDAGFSPIDLPQACFYENPYALSLGYGVPESIVDFQVPEGLWWENLNAFTNAVAGWPVNPYRATEGVEDSLVAQSLDMEAFKQAISQLKEHEFAFEDFGGSHISGTIDVGEGQMLLMTIPNQAGWSVWVNGEEVQPQDVANGALMAIPVTTGMNQVEMRFMPPGLIPGAVLSVLALLFIALAPLIRRRNSHAAG